MSATPRERRQRLEAIELGSPELRAAERRDERFYVVSVTGDSISGAAGVGSRSRTKPTHTSYSVLDRLVDFREVARFTPYGKRTSADCKAMADREAHRRNVVERSRGP